MLSGSKIKVAFTLIASKEWVGGLNYFKNLFTVLNKYSNIEPVVFLDAKQNNAYLINNLENISNVIITDKIFNQKSILNKLNRKSEKFFKKSWFYDKYFQNNGIEIISHSNFYNEKSCLKKINWIPDFQYIHFPQMFSKEEITVRNYHNKKIAEKSDIVILSSNDALKDFKQFAPEYSNKSRILPFVVLPDPSVYDDNKELNNNILKKYCIADKFFYIPNQFWKHKNHIVVFEAVKILKEQGVDIKVVCTGQFNDPRNKEYANSLKSYIDNNNLSESIRILGLIEYKEVLFFMRNCISLINPSFFEGWNTMVEEAKSIGKSVILSDLDVHKEQNPPNGVYFDPNDPMQLADILKDKWDNFTLGPDYELEESSKKQLPGRLKIFASNYENYVKELVKD